MYDDVILCDHRTHVQVILHLNEQSDNRNIERLKFLLSEMETEVVMKSWDLSVKALIGSAKIQDYFTKSERGDNFAVVNLGPVVHNAGVDGKYQVILSSGSNERKFLNATYCKVTRNVMVYLQHLIHFDI